MTTSTTAARTAARAATMTAMLTAIMLGVPGIAIASPNNITPAPSPVTHVPGGFYSPDGTDSGPANTPPPCITPSLCQVNRPVEPLAIPTLTGSNSGANDQVSVAGGLGVGVPNPGSAFGNGTVLVPAHLSVQGQNFTRRGSVHVDIIGCGGSGDATADWYGNVTVPTTALTGTTKNDMPSCSGRAVATDGATGRVSAPLAVEVVPQQ